MTTRKKPTFKELYFGFGYCGICNKKRALRPVKIDGGWACRRCFEGLGPGGGVLTPRTFPGDGGNKQ